MLVLESSAVSPPDGKLVTSPIMRRFLWDEVQVLDTSVKDLDASCKGRSPVYLDGTLNQHQKTNVFYLPSCADNEKMVYWYIWI